MDRDFRVHETGVDPWETEISEDRELVIFLNRLAIASSQSHAIEQPFAEIRVGGKRASVTAIRGQLIYSDLHRVNVQNLKVIAEEAVGFLTDRIRPGSEELDGGGDDEPVVPVRYHDHGWRTAQIIRGAAFTFLAAVLILLGVRIYEAVSDRSTLMDRTSFVPGLADKQGFFDRYSGIFFDETGDGGRLIEISADGRFRLYQIEGLPGDTGWLREPLEDLPLTLGMSEGREAALGGGTYLLVPLDKNTIRLFGRTFTRYDERADRFGLWPGGR